MKIRKTPSTLFGMMLGTALAIAGTDISTPSVSTMAGWITAMKQQPRGPFDQVRWFCADGAVLKPEAFACKDRGGGVQHGQWNHQTSVLRDNGYFVGNVLISTDPEYLAGDPDGDSLLKQLLVERFLIQEDDGWIFHLARSHRGVFQAEDELMGANRIVMALLKSPSPKRFLLAREAMRLLPRLNNTLLIDKVRIQSSELAQQHQPFETLRNKIHSAPSPEDAQAVAAFLPSLPDTAQQQLAEQLVSNIRLLYQRGQLDSILRQAIRTAAHGDTKAALTSVREKITADPSPENRLREIGPLLALLRHSMVTIQQPLQRYRLMRLNLELEQEIFSAGSSMLARITPPTRREQLDWLRASSSALYGSGLITLRQLNSLKAAIKKALNPSINLGQYRQELQYLARAPEWAGRQLQFHFGQAISKLDEIEPLASHFIPNRLRASPLLLYTRAMDSLLLEANRMAGVTQRLFGRASGLGLKALNPGLARGPLLKPPVAGTDWNPNGIYLLPQTIQDLPPVAGILTLNAGNALSHVQLLAENLGIPNVVVQRPAAARLENMLGKTIVLSVTPGGQVEIAEDSPRWETFFPKQGAKPEGQIEVNVQKLQLDYRQPVSLGKIRSEAAGRIAGPKAANLGELKHHFPESVTRGLVIPFGYFSELLEQPFEQQGPSAIEWLKEQYRAINHAASSNQRSTLTHRTLERFRQWIVNRGMNAGLAGELRHALRREFGEDGSYGVFIRSDTNVEDLPGFTGAGLNLTLPHVIGSEQILQGILQVWASPFSARAFAWRQGRMDHPEHVYPSVLLLKSVAAEKSGVMVTADLEYGQSGWYSVAVNQGIGGAVQGESAEELLISKQGEQRLLAEATAPTRRALHDQGGLTKLPVTPDERILTDREIQQLIAFVDRLPTRFHFVDEQGRPAPADIEFGFSGGKLALFQIRPYLRKHRAQRNLLLLERDLTLQQTALQRVWQ